MLEALRELPSRTMLVGGSVEKKRDPEKPNISLNPLFKKVINETRYLTFKWHNCIYVFRLLLFPIPTHLHLTLYGVPKNIYVYIV